MALKLMRFQREFVRGALASGVDTAALSIPRGNGKSQLAGLLVANVMTPGAWMRPGTESVLCAASIEQARIVFRFCRHQLELGRHVGEYSFVDAANRVGILHKPTNTRLRIIGSNGKKAMGLVGCPWAICDEPGAWEVAGGELLWDALATAQGKPRSPLRILLIGTLAPSRGGWWPQMVKRGTHRSTYVMALQGDPERWDQWPEIRRCNPLSNIDAPFRKKLLEERDEARADTRLKARFCSYRLNLPSADESEVLLTVDDWKRVMARPEGLPAGRPVVGIDLGGGRAWSAAVAVWRSGRIEALAIAPGIPDVEAQERRDRVPRGTYQALVDGGSLMLAHGLRVPHPAQLIGAATERWGVPEAIFCDRFRINELRDTQPPCRVIARAGRYSEAAADIRSLRRLAKDGPLSCPRSSQGLLTASLAAAMVKPDDSGNSRLVKRGTNGEARDDVAAALVLAAGAVDRIPRGAAPRVLVV